ncbi:glycosyltransferase involved in cell wall biosynthesis [Naumannella cuiyingiana]|uniref:Glycosyltransferase involved in cell wall biosynthesis n=1 Tax=Naumannella cuiyingiana TaxID=1347891 RepID=A0A7Z0D7V4_9ACTN|nr:glycosyltransferase involved in cell wall biosynthesis [Naumannella cuiyingiana]
MSNDGHPPTGDGSAASTLRILAFGTYQADTHPRVRALIEGLRELGHEVIEVNEPLGLSTAERVAMLRRFWRLPALGVRIAHRWARLIRRGRRAVREAARRGQPVDAVLVGYLAHFDVRLARRVFRDQLILLDHLIFAANTATDRGQKSPVINRALQRLDHRAMSAADVIVVDTAEHRDRVPEELRARAVVCPVGADASWFRAGAAAAPPDLAATGELRVVFYGLYTPLQGAEVIGSALRLLADQPIRATMIGSGQDLPRARRLAGAGARAEWIDWVPADQLPAVVADHHVALGIFGTSDKARNVVPNKVYQSAAAGCAIVTSDTAPQRRALAGQVELVDPGSPEQLAAALRRLQSDPQLLASRRRQAAALAAREFSAAAAAQPLAARVDEILRRPATPGAMITCG